jgi:hypothetical protein
VARPKVRHTRADVIARTRREFEELDALVSRLGPDDWAKPAPRPETRDPWTVEDALIHIVYWKEHTVRVLRGERRPPEMRGLEVGEVNALVYVLWRDRPPAEAVKYHREVHADVMRTLETIPEERITGKERSVEWPLDFDLHSADHRRRDMEAAIPGG